MDALKSVTTRRTPQNEQAREDQVVNNAGGHVFQITDEERLRRFLVLGTDGGTYYASEKALTKENGALVIRLARTDPLMVIRVIHELDLGNRAPKHNTLLFALAAVAGLAPDPIHRRQALVDLRSIARTGTHLFTFVGYAQQFRGWGRGLRSAVADWYLSGDVGQTAFQMVKYRNREGWTHRDLLRKSHPVTAEPQRRALFAWAAGKNPAWVPRIVADWHRAQVTTGDRLLQLVKTSALTHDMLPDSAKSRPDIWMALIERGMPLGALIRQLPKLTRLGVFDDARTLGIVVGKFKDPEELRRARIHPYNVLVAQKTYASGRSEKGDSTWTPKRQIVDALNDAFYASFGNVTPTGKRFLLALDVSGSMGHPILGSSITARAASAALSLVTLATETNVEVVGFTALEGGLTLAPRTGTMGYSWNHRSISELAISPRQRLDDVERYISRLDFGRTDCALPMLYAMEKGLEVDVFVVYTDNETWHGNVHPYQALVAYRQKTGIDAKLIVVGMTATEFSIADPNDAGMLDIVGFDAAGPELIANFARGL